MQSRGWSDPPLSAVPIPLPSYSPSTIKGKALQGELEALIAKRAVELAPSSPGLYSCLFVVQKASGSWRPVIDMLSLNGFVQLTPFRMESNQSVLQSIRSFDWMISIDLKNAYLQVPIHPDSRKFLRFVVDSRVYQFKALCFGLSTAPQVFTRVMDPVSRTSQSSRYRNIRTPCSDVTISGRLAGSRLISSGGSGAKGQGNANVQSSQDCSEPREIIVSSIPDGDLLGDGTGQPVFEGFSDSQADRNRPRADHWISVLQTAKSGLLARSLGSPDVVMPSSAGWSSSVSADMSPRVLGLCRRVGLGGVDRHDSFRSSVVVGRSKHSRRGLSRYPSYASDQGWGAHAGDQFASGRWSQEEIEMSINLRELRAIRLGLQHFHCQLVGSSVGVFADNTTALAYV